MIWLFQRWFGAVRIECEALCIDLCNHPDQADDLAQQVFLKVWKSIGQVRDSRAFYGWLRRIMISTWLEEVRRAKLDFAELDDATAAGAPNESPGVRIDLDAALAQLPPTMRLCIVLSYNDGLSHQEISDATQYSPGNG